MFGSYILKFLLRTVFKNIKIVFSENGNCFLNLMFHVLSLFSLLFLFFRTENDF